MKGGKETAILLLSCADRKGIVAEISNFIYHNDGNIIHSDQHADFETGTFFMRLEWELEKFRVPREEIGSAFRPIAEKFSMEWNLRFSGTVPRMAIMVSKYDHCLYDILLKHREGIFRAEVPVIISNHGDLKPIADYFGIDYRVVPVDAEGKQGAEERELEILGKLGIDFIVLARYMQVLSDGFVSRYRNRIINIHHSFLPAFVGARPYQQAFARGVKLIGATSHYVTEDLDNGPIIEQGVIRISHRDSLADLVQKGKELEKAVLSRAVKHHLENKILVFGSKTVVFD